MAVFRLKAVIVDVDGTLTEGPLERPFMDFENSLNDRCNERIAGLIRTLSLSYNVLVLTARKEKHTRITKTWLHKQNIPFHQLYLRDNYDDSSGQEFKKTVYQDKISELYEVDFAFDDQLPIINMWREFGIYTIHVS